MHNKCQSELRCLGGWMEATGQRSSKEPLSESEKKHLVWPMDKSINSALNLLRTELDKTWKKKRKSDFSESLHPSARERFLASLRREFYRHWLATDRAYGPTWPFVSVAWHFRATGRRGCKRCQRQPRVDPLFESAAKVSRVNLQLVLRQLPNCWELRLQPGSIQWRNDD
jgi:hypothetical protein